MSTDASIISFACDTCGKPYEASVIYAGRTAVCSGCGKKLTIPSQSAEPATTGESPLDSSELQDLAETADASEFEYGANGTIYYAEPPRELTDEEDAFPPEDFAPDSTEPAQQKPGLLDSAAAVPASPQDEGESLLRLALAKQLEWKQAIAAERERNNALQFVIEVEKREKARQQQAVRSRRARIRAWRIRLLVALLIVYCGLAYTGYIGDWLVLSPTREAILVPLEKPRQIPMAGGDVLEIWTARSRGIGTAEPDAYVLALCGNDQRAETAASMALDRFVGHKVEVWSPNYPGFGGSSGRASLESAVSAATVGFDVLRNVAHGKPIFVTGQNLGSAIALSMAAHNREVTGMVLYDPAPLKELMLRRYGWFNLWIVGGPVAWFSPRELDTVALARNGRAPAVFIVAGSDSLVPVSYQRGIIDAYAGDHRTVEAPQDGHDGLSAGRFSSDATDWLFSASARK